MGMKLDPNPRDRGNVAQGAPPTRITYPMSMPAAPPVAAPELGPYDNRPYPKFTGPTPMNVVDHAQKNNVLVIEAGQSLRTPAVQDQGPQPPMAPQKVPFKFNP